MAFIYDSLYTEGNLKLSSKKTMQLLNIEHETKHVDNELKVGLSPFKKKIVFSVIKSPLKMMKNAFYFIVKAFLVLKIFKFLSRLFGHEEKRLD